MPVRFACPVCGSVLKVPDNEAGKKGGCPKCGQRLQSPAPRNSTMLAVPVPAAHPPALPRSRSKLFIVAAGIGVLSVAFWLILKQADFFGAVKEKPTAEPSSAQPPVDKDDQRLAKEYLLKTIDDPSSFEVAEWGGVRSVVLTNHKPASVLHLKWRGNNRFGAKELKESMFLIQAGKVLGCRPVNESSPAQFVYTQLGPIAAEQVQGKWTRVIVQGTITWDGKPQQVAKGGGVVLGFRREGEEFPDFGTTAQKTFGKPLPDYERVWILPGKYEVSLVYVSPGDPNFGPKFHRKEAKFQCVVKNDAPIQRIDFNAKSDPDDPP